MAVDIRSSIFRATLAALAMLSSIPLRAQDRPRAADDEIGAKLSATFTVATVGDIIAPLPFLRDDSRFKPLVTLIRAADVGFANMESSLVDLRDFGGGVAGTVAPLALGDSLKGLGITLVNHANNHALDGGIAGMVSTDRALDQLGIVHAGTGPNLQEARAPRFVETAKGRVGLVGAFSVNDTGLFGPNYAKTEATAREGDMGGTPGVNAFHLTSYNIVTDAQLATLQQLARAIYGERAGADVHSADGHERFRFFDQWYQAGDDPGSIHYEMNTTDEQALLAAIRSGKVQSDFLIATIHSHQTPRFCSSCAFGANRGLKEGLDHVPPDYLVRLAHEAIDAGADMFVTHGVHALAGIEIYKGHPIFYGLSNFVFQFGLQPGAGYDAMANYKQRQELENPASLEGILATSHFVGGKLVEVRLFPVDLGDHARPISQLGIPLVPAPAVARRILQSLQDWSRLFGTAIVIKGEMGIISIDNATLRRR